MIFFFILEIFIGKYGTGTKPDSVMLLAIVLVSLFGSFSDLVFLLNADPDPDSAPKNFSKTK
jgi:hypothetical protein